ncbi:MAG: phosphoglucomutase (alpha-D-glucose-1,6-bisphosphate-dependent) [Dokdonella sp.]|uniref:phosphoglucomutase (alpha-D-glucose-1,6-bisphosphate-dependent) n=1 Tax=Dokdonella sp. TaxID=2291710 RepID=UPI003266774D
MASRIEPGAGKPAPTSSLVDIGRLLDAYSAIKPDPANPLQRVAFGTSGHRGTSFDGSFNEHHILAISQAVCEHRASQKIDGPLFIGIDTHALSVPAFETAVEVLAANGVEVRYAADGEFTPTPAVSHAILVHNRDRDGGFADGIVVTPSHNPPSDGGFKYNPPNGGAADTNVTGWIQDRANALLAGGLREVRRMPFAQALAASTTSSHDFLSNYVDDLGSVIDFDAIRGARVRMGVDPLGGAGVHYWARIAEHYRIDLDVVSATVDPQFAFMTLDWDGKIRMDPSSSYAMQRLIALKDRYDIAFACDTDHDRHGVVAPSVGLMPANHYLSASVDYLFRHRREWSTHAAVGKTVVTSAMIGRIAAKLGRRLFDVPVGFKWFAPGLLDGSLGFGCEESAGASFLRRDGRVWTTDKDGIAAALLSAEITAVGGRDPGAAYRGLCDDLGEIFADRRDAKATPEQKKTLSKLSPVQITSTSLAGNAITAVLDKAPANDAPIGGIKVESDGGWFAARPSGTENIYKIYAESFRDTDHLQQILGEAQDLVDRALAGA